MKTITQTASICLNGRLLPVNNAKGKSLGCYVQILRKLEKQMTAVLSHHSKMRVVRFDLHCNDFVPDNKLISQFMKLLKTRLPKEYDRLSYIGYIWARETGSRSGKTHYHLALLLNGNAICSAKYLTNICEELWKLEIGQGQVQTNWEHHRVIRRGDEAAFCDVFYWLSYLAKVYTKGQRAPTANDYSGSQIKLKVVKCISIDRATTTPETNTAPHYRHHSLKAGGTPESTNAGIHKGQALLSAVAATSAAAKLQALSFTYSSLPQG